MDVQEIDLETAGARVMRGLAWLQEHGAKFGLDVTRVDLDTLDVSNGDACVLAQSLGGDRYYDYWSQYGRALVRIHGERWGHEDWSEDHGFIPLSSDDQEPLNAAWRAILAPPAPINS